MVTSHIGFLACLLVEFQLANADVAPPGWAVRVLARCELHIWRRDVFHRMYESQVCCSPKTRKIGFSIFYPFGQVPPFTLQSAIHTLSCDLCPFSRIGVLTLLWSSISESWRLAMYRRPHMRITSASVGSFDDFGSFML